MSPSNGNLVKRKKEKKKGSDFNNLQQSTKYARKPFLLKVETTLEAKTPLSVTRLQRKRRRRRRSHQQLLKCNPEVNT